MYIKYIRGLLKGVLVTGSSKVRIRKVRNKYYAHERVNTCLNQNYPQSPNCICMDLWMRMDVDVDADTSKFDHIHFFRSDSMCRPTYIAGGKLPYPYRTRTNGTLA